LRLKIPKYSYSWLKYCSLRDSYLGGEVDVWNASYCMHLYKSHRSWGNEHQNINDSFIFYKNLVSMYQNIVLYTIWIFFYFETQFSKKVKLPLMFWCSFPWNMWLLYRWYNSNIHLTSYESCKLWYKYEYFAILSRNFSKLKPVIDVLMLIYLKHVADV